MAGGAGRADLADDGEDQVLGRNTGRQPAIDDCTHVLRLALDQRLRHQHMLGFGGAYPKRERAEGAVGRGVAVAAHDRGAGQYKTLLRPDDVADALAGVEFVIIFEAEQFCILGEIGDLRRAFGIEIWLAAIRGRHVVVDDQKRFSRSFDRQAGSAQRGEGLRAVHFIHEMAVDIEQARAVRLLVHDMVVPDPVMEREGQGCLS